MTERILVVEDEARIASLISRNLRMEGYQVEVAPDGETALEKALSKPPDLIVLDVMLPDIDGLEVCRQLRMAGSDEPVLMLTAKDAIPDRVAGLDYIGHRQPPAVPADQKPGGGIAPDASAGQAVEDLPVLSLVRLDRHY